MDTPLSLPPAVRFPALPDASLSSIELRLRLEPNSACVESMAAHAEGLGTPSRAKTDASLPAASIPMMVTDRASGRRWEVRCGG